MFTLHHSFFLSLLVEELKAQVSQLKEAVASLPSSGSGPPPPPPPPPLPAGTNGYQLVLN